MSEFGFICRICCTKFVSANAVDLDGDIIWKPACDCFGEEDTAPSPAYDINKLYKDVYL